MNALVVEVRARQSRQVRAALNALPEVLSVTQLGTLLRVLVRRDLAEPVAVVQEVLDRAGINAQARLAPPSLEDVFVTATSIPANDPARAQEASG